MFVKNAFQAVFRRNITIKTELKIVWNEPEKIPLHKPAKSGDLDGPMKLDMTAPALAYRGSRELETADDNVKKMFSLSFARRREARLAAQYEVIKSVQQNKYDFESYEVLLAKQTEHIRWLQEYVEEDPRNKRAKTTLLEMIARRKADLNQLRGLDYKKFEWILEKLNLVYKDYPYFLKFKALQFFTSNLSDFTIMKCSRNYALRKLTQLYCDEVRNRKLFELRKKLRAEQPRYLAEKIEKLTKMRNDQIELGIDVTITEEDIQTSRQLLDSLNKQISA